MQFHDQLWKRELRSQLAAIGSINITSETEDRLFEAEKPIFYAAFIIRKLIEDTAVTDQLKSKSIGLNASGSNRNGQDFFLEPLMGPLRVSDWFDIQNPQPIRISYFDLASEIIHSNAFVWHIGAKAPGEFLVCSYRNTLKRLLWVPVSEFMAAIEAVINDRPTNWWTSKDLNTGKITAHAE